jgi:hypothetical protein
MSDRDQQDEQARWFGEWAATATNPYDAPSAWTAGRMSGIAEGERAAIFRIQVEVTRLSECGDDGDVVLDVTDLETVLREMLEGRA